MERRGLAYGNEERADERGGGGEARRAASASWIIGVGAGALLAVGMARAEGPDEGTTAHSLLSGVAVVGGGMLLS